MEKILITGGGGYLGAKLAGTLLSASRDIYLMDIGFNAIAEGLFSRHPNCHKVEMDLRDAEALSEACLRIRPDYVFHFAARIDRSRDFGIYEAMYEANVQATLHLLRALREVDYKSFIYSGTSEVYGTRNPLPFHEAMLPQAVSPYSLTKQMAENLIRGWSGLYEKPWTIFRIFNFYGPEMPPSTFIPQLLKAIGQGEDFEMTAGAQARDYLHIDDLLYYLRESSFRNLFPGEIVNLCSGRAVTMREIADTILKITGTDITIKKTLPYRANEIWEIRGDNTRLRSAFPDYEVRGISEGLKEMLENQ
jgi:UDP-glucose 4-epimerase